MVSPSNGCVYIWYKANELVQARRLKVPVDITSCWWKGAASSVAGGHDPVLRGLGVTGRLVSNYSLLSLPAPLTLSCGAHARRVTGHECPLIILCNATCYQLSNLQ